MAEARRTLLIAEDDFEIRNLIRARVEAEGFDTRLARNGRETLSMLDAPGLAGVLLDINMPLLDGFGVLEAAQRLSRAPPILVLTARHASGDVQRAIALGARDYLTKPFTERQLSLRLRRLVRPRLAEVAGGGESALI